jgi:hypothetical protein
MWKHYIVIIGIVLGIIVLGSCARVGSPTGGPRDTIPPQLVLSEPQMYATEFDESEIELVFDEYIQLNNANSELIVSPPVDEKPQVKLRNRSVLIDLNNELRDSVTYTINFGDAIVDFNEGNPVSGFEFVFSTGSHIDSFSVAGKLVNSFNLEPYEEEVYVMLYENLTDSAPLLELPAFIGKATDEGNFAINNVKSDTFRIFALKDANNSLTYDLPNEQIAFHDSVVFLSPQLFSESDTIVADSSLISNGTADTVSFVSDTTQLLDTSNVRKTYTFYTPLFMFEEEKRMQYLTDDNRDDKHRLRFIFNTPVDTIHFKPLNIEKENWYYPEYADENDTIDLWLADTNLVQKDSILLAVSHYGLDTAQNKVWLTDTIMFKAPEEKSSSRQRRNADEEPEDKNMPQFITLNVRSGSTVDLNSVIRINSKHPISSVDTGNIRLAWTVDSIMHEADFTFLGDSLPSRHFKISSDWKEAARYELFIEPNTFENIYHYPHDTIQVNFKTQSADYYGKILLNLKNVPHDLIIQLLSRETIAMQKVIETDGVYTFDYLEPKEYSVKLIYDRNGNGEWDTGNYLKNWQPERVDFYPEKISVRSNWEIEYEWDVKK